MPGTLPLLVYMTDTTSCLCVSPGVLPFANVLSIPAINSFCFRRFVGAGASVVSKTPFLRYLSMFGMIDVSARTIAKVQESSVASS